MTTCVYLATPLDQGTVAYDLPKLSDLAIYQPGVAWAMPGPTCAPDPTVQQINRAAVLRCHGLVAVLMAGHPSIGVPAEVEWAIDAGKPVAIVSDLVFSSWMLAYWRACPRVTLVDVSSSARPVSSGINAACRWVQDQCQP